MLQVYIGRDIIQVVIKTVNSSAEIKHLDFDMLF